jgi:hypothetical protein
MFKYCINRGRFVSVYASIKSDAETGASERKRPFKLTSERAEGIIWQEITANI